MQENKGKLGEHYPIICMARTNLIRFIKYKSSRWTSNISVLSDGQ